MSIRTIYINNTKIANEIRKYDDLKNHRNVVIIGHRRSNTFGAKGEQIKTDYVIEDNLSIYDCAVADAVYTLCKNDIGHDYSTSPKSFTIGQVLKVLSGNPRQTLTKNHRTDIENSLEKLRSTKLTIRCTDEMRERGIIGESESKIINRPFLPAEKDDDRYYVTDKMPLYEYAEMTHQFISAPPLLLYKDKDTEGINVTNSKENILIKRYLIRRIEIMRNPKNQIRDRKILYSRISHRNGALDGMFADIGVYKTDYQSEASWKNKRSSIHKTVTKILTYYKNIGYIEGFELITGEKGAIHGIMIDGKINNPWQLKDKKKRKKKNA